MSENQCNYYAPSDFTDIIEGDPTSTTNTSFFSLNCRSLPAHWDSINQLLCEISSEKFSFDVIGLSEIFRISPNICYNLEGYHNFEYKIRPDDDDGRGGVGIFVKENINFKVRHDLSVFIPHVIETLFIELEYSNTKNIIVGNIYRPNTLPRADIDMFIENLNIVISAVGNENKNLLLMGDFNLDLLKFDSHPKTSDFINNLHTAGLSTLITKPTRITEHSATLIDHMYTNIIKNDIHTGILITDISDHFGTFAIFKHHKSPKILKNL